MIAFDFVASDLSGLAIVVGGLALVLLPMYAKAARDRASSRRAHARVATSGNGAWYVLVDPRDLRLFFPALRVGLVRGMFLSEGIPMGLDLDSSGLRLAPRGWWMRRFRDRVWSAPWSEVLGAETQVVGFKTLGGKISLVRLTDVLISTVGESAHTFLDEWEFLDDVDAAEFPFSDDPAEQADWLEYAKQTLGPSWRPGSALLRIRTSAPDGLAEAITRWARGRLPD